MGISNGMPSGNAVWGYPATDVLCRINDTYALFKTVEGLVFIQVEPAFDFVSMNDACYTLVANALGATVDPTTGLLFVNCELLKTGPDIILGFGGHEFTMIPESYIFHDTASGVCTLLFVNTPGLLSIGAPFMINYYSIFDISNSRFGFARAVHPKFYPGHQASRA
ncbi:hypothetical protein HDU76_001842 [Blyttiomyces sp. JEL0837]|nr:hypothetical protein HDU76_001842 [Blyttiomyces sp. JEL0837]